MIRTCTNNVGSALASGLPTVVCPNRHTRSLAPPDPPSHRRLRYVSGHPSVRPSDLMSVYQPAARASRTSLATVPDCPTRPGFGRMHVRVVYYDYATWPLCPIAPLALASAA
eukprot:COSAG01_NODE_32_length_35644_cov_22.273738_27_plen_112_part_00